MYYQLKFTPNHFIYYPNVALNDAHHLSTNILIYVIGHRNTMIAILEGTTESAIEENEETRYSQTVSFGANLEDGKYFIRAIYKATGDDNWKVCKEYNYLSITINGLSLSIGVIDKYTQKIKVNSVTSDK